MKIAFYGSSLLSSYWNGAATYYRGVSWARSGGARLATSPSTSPPRSSASSIGDIDPPEWCRAASSIPRPTMGLRAVLAEAGEADIVVKANGVGVYDRELLEGTIARARRAGRAASIFWDVDAAATLDEMRARRERIPCCARCPTLDLVLTYGGGPPVIDAYEGFGATSLRARLQRARSRDASSPSRPIPASPCDLAFLGNRLPDREARVEEFFLQVPRRRCPERQLPDRRQWLGDEGDAAETCVIAAMSTPAEHNAFNCDAQLAVLNVARDSAWPQVGFSPATRVFEAAGAAACLITDAWEGIEQFLTPDREVLVARDGQDVAGSSRRAHPGAGARRSARRRSPEYLPSTPMRSVARR